MTSQVAAELPFYSQDGSFLGYAGYAASLVLELTQAQDAGPLVAQNLDGRLFEQRVMTQEGETLLTITGFNRPAGQVVFKMTSAESLTLLASDAVARDLVHLVAEVTEEGLTPLLQAPFALRRVRPGLGAVVLKLEPTEGVVMVRYAGAPPLTLLQEMIALGQLPEGATDDDLLDLVLIGPEGPQGPQGIQGPAGPAGSDGFDGADGAHGPQGIQGPAGAQGPAGPPGDDGADGAAGSQGPQGIQGPAGAAGAQGPQGIQGPPGAAGAAGAAGPAGAAGAQGPQGIQGPAGAAGPAGPQGPEGPTSALLDVVSALGGFDEGWAYTDMNGWTTAAYHFSPSGEQGQVVRHKIPGADFSGLPSAYRIIEPLPDDITVIGIVGQSNIVGQDSVPMPARTASDFSIKLDTMKPNSTATAFGTAFTQAAPEEYITGATLHQGVTLGLKAGDVLEQMILDRQGLTQADHGRQVIFLYMGLSSSDVSGFSYPSAHFARMIAWFTAAKAAADLAGKTIKLRRIIWGWGAYAYDNNVGQASVSASIQGYCGPTGDIATRILPLLGQTGEVVKVGFIGSHHHYRATDEITPFVAMAEQALVIAQPDRYQHVEGEGIHFLNGLDRGWGGSTSHHHPNEEEEIAGPVADWLYTDLVHSRTWCNMMPTFARTGANQVTASIANFPAASSFGFRASGLFPGGAQPNYGWFLCDPATPTVELALTRLPYPGPTPGTIIFDTVSALPANLEIRHGCRDNVNNTAGNLVVIADDPVVTTVKGVATPVYRSMPAMKVQVA